MVRAMVYIYICVYHSCSESRPISCAVDFEHNSALVWNLLFE